MAASSALRDYFAEVMAERRTAPGDDLISDLVRAEIDGERLNDEEIYSFLRLLLPAGVETTYRASGSLLFALLNDRAQFDALYARPLALRSGVRGGGPLGAAGHGDPAAGRCASTELAGVKIDEGADVALDDRRRQP